MSQSLEFPISKRRFRDFGATVTVVALLVAAGMALRIPQSEAESPRPIPPPSLDEPANTEATSELAILAGGCFWPGLLSRRALPADFFDLILFDEGHHSVAESYAMLKAQFPAARIVNFGATPERADGQVMAGRVVYSYPIFRAIQERYVKRLKAVQLNPRTLRYVRREDDQEIEVSLDEVRRLGEDDADFRRSIVTSQETLNTIVDASMRELDRLRTVTGDNRLKIIASALNYRHCQQIVEAYRARGRRADYVHSREGSVANQRVMQRLESHQLDVIVQVRKLGEGFDHPRLSVAAVFSTFSNLSPFVQFVGRIMRVIEQNAPAHVLNQGVVVFHAGGNIARQWADFQTYSEADRDYFDQLLFCRSRASILTTRGPNARSNRYRLILQTEWRFARSPTFSLKKFRCCQMTLPWPPFAYCRNTATHPTISPPPMKLYSPCPPPWPGSARPGASALTCACALRRRELGQRGINPEGSELDRQRLGKSNLIVMKAALDRQVNAIVGRSTRQRHEFSRDELDQIDQAFTTIITTAIAEVFNGSN